MKLRLTKNELRKQKDALKRFLQYLPTLLLKKQQLQSELLKIHNMQEEEKERKAYLKAKIYEWVDVFGEDAKIKDLLSVKEIKEEEGNIAGIDIPIFQEVVFEETEYDYSITPIWVDYGVEALKEVITINAKIETFQIQHRLVQKELRITTQRVNLFEKVKIPETKNNLQKIQIYLGDMQTAAVVTGKIAKEKIQRKAMSRQ